MVWIKYDMVISDHTPISMLLNVDNIPALVQNKDISNASKLDWVKLSDVEKDKYFSSTDKLLGLVELPKNALLCQDVKCKNLNHGWELCSLYGSIFNSLVTSSISLITPRGERNRYAKPGWNEHE